MKLFLSSCVLAALGGLTWAAPWQQAQPTTTQEARPAHEQETPLMQQMERIEDAMDFLKRSVRDPTNNVKSLEKIVAAERACIEAKQLTPKMTANVPDGERAKFVTDFRKGVAALLVEFVNLETALLDGDNEKAKGIWKRLDDMETEGHNAFTDGE